MWKNKLYNDRNLASLFRKYAILLAPMVQCNILCYMKPKLYKILRNVAGFVVALVILYFVFNRLAAGWSEVGEQIASADWLQAITGVVIISLSLAISAFVWRRIMKDCYAEKVSWSQAFIIINLANISRYIPGKLWFILGIVYFAKMWKINQRNAVVIAFTNQIIAIVAAIFIGAIFIGTEGMKVFPWWAAILLLIFGFIALQPKVLHRLLSVVIKRKGGEGETRKIPKMSILTAVYGILLMSLLWLGVGFGLVIAGQSFIHDIRWADYQAITGGFTLSYVAGYISIIVPSGLGVREGILMLFMPQSLSEAQQAAFSLSTRIWMTFAELLNVIAATIALKIISRNKQPTAESAKSTKT